jgi:DNA-binding NtrC family response regulator
MNEFSTRTLVRPRSKPTAVRVTVLAGPSAGASATGAKITVGRSRVADMAVADPTVSEFHLELAGHEHGIEVKDLESWNGTWFEGARIASGAVPSGASLVIGESTIRVEAVADAAASKAAVDSFRGLVGKSAAMRELFALLERLAPTDLSVCVHGPTGSGKELVARAIHDGSARAKGRFVVLDCAALPASLAESVLFGHAAGAFTGANEARAGVFEAADGGTLFLDEIGELPLDLQPKLLRVLEQRQVMRVGETKPRAVSVRVVSATWRDLRRMVNKGQFRDDLYFRLAQTRIDIPALVDRREDVELLANDFLRKLPRKAACARAISREAMAELGTRDWPGNVRELRNTIERAAFMCDGPTIRPHDLAFDRMMDRVRESSQVDIVDPDGDSDDGLIPDFKGAKRTAVDDFERDYLARVMMKSSGNLAVAAGLAGIERHYLRSLLKKHGLHSRGE